MRNGHVLATSTSLKKVMLYVGDLYLFPAINRTQRHHRLTKLVLPTGNSDSQPEPVFLGPQSWALWVLSNQAMLTGTVAHAAETKTAALMKVDMMIESTFTRAHLSGWLNSHVTWSSVVKRTSTTQFG